MTEQLADPAARHQLPGSFMHIVQKHLGEELDSADLPRTIQTPGDNPGDDHGRHRGDDPPRHGLQGRSIMGLALFGYCRIGSHETESIMDRTLLALASDY